MNTNCIIARQPILDRNEHLHGYELLFRATTANEAAVENDWHATANVILNTLASFGVKELLDGHKGFINFDYEMLMDESVELLPQEHTVIELLESIRPTSAVVERCKSLKKDGFVLALDGHVYHPDFAELYAIVDIIKIDLLQTPRESLPEIVELLQPYPCKLLAEKVESKELFNICHSLGFEYFQGYYFAKPDIVKKKKMTENATTVIKLLRHLLDDVSMHHIEEEFRKSPVLSYKLLMLVNSLAFGNIQKIQGVRHAIAIVGRNQIKRWLQLVLFADGGEGEVAQPLINMAASRAGLMEQLALVHPQLQYDKESSERAFMTGILSLIERIYNISISEMVLNLNLNEEVAAALTHRKGLYGGLLTIVECIEAFDLLSASEKLTSIGINPNVMPGLQARSYAWRKNA
jgi:EAL and modified HD-GYP domain-containing signal transduction protein